MVAIDPILSGSLAPDACLGGLIVAAVGWGAALGIGGLLVLMYMHEWIVAFLMYRRVKADQGSQGGPSRTQVVPQSVPPSSRPIFITLQDQVREECEDPVLAVRSEIEEGGE